MKHSITLVLAAFALAACDARVETPPAENHTTIVNPAEKKETTVVNPPAEKKTETTTVTGSGGSTVEKKTETKQ